MRSRIEPALRAKGRLGSAQLADLDRADSALIDDRAADSEFGRSMYRRFLTRECP